MKPLFLALTVLTLAAVFLLNPARATLAQTEPAMPPGVSAEAWIPLSDRAGILITSPGSPPARQPHGRMVVEIDGQWTDIDLINRGGMTPLNTHSQQ